MARRIKGGIKRSETDSSSNQFPKCYPQPRKPKKIQKDREEKGEGGDRGNPLGEKGESKGGESNQASDLAPK